MKLTPLLQSKINNTALLLDVDYIVKAYQNFIVFQPFLYLIEKRFVRHEQNNGGKKNIREEKSAGCVAEVEKKSKFFF